jgi:hypothetical protein
MPTNSPPVNATSGGPLTTKCIKRLPKSEGQLALNRRSRRIGSERLSHGSAWPTSPSRRVARTARQLVGTALHQSTSSHGDSSMPTRCSRFVAYARFRHLRPWGWIQCAACVSLLPERLSDLAG